MKSKIGWAFFYILPTAVAIWMLIGIMGCGDQQLTPAPTQVVVEAPPAPPAVVIAAPAPVPFCPYTPPAHLSGNVKDEQLTFTFEPELGPNGEFLKRHQIVVERWHGGDNEFHQVGVVEVEIKSLGGPHNRQAYATVQRFPNGGTLKARIRSHYPNECHADGAGNNRLNTEWSKWTDGFGG